MGLARLEGLANRIRALEADLERKNEALREIADDPDAAQGWKFQKLALAALTEAKEEAARAN